MVTPSPAFSATKSPPSLSQAVETSPPALLLPSRPTPIAVPAPRAFAAASTPANTTRPWGCSATGAMTEYISVPRSKLYTAFLSLKELCPRRTAHRRLPRRRTRARHLNRQSSPSSAAAESASVAIARHRIPWGPDRRPSIWTTGSSRPARRAGAKHTVNTGREDLHAKLQAITSGRGPDVMIEAIGLPSTFRAAVRRGRLHRSSRLHRLRQGARRLRDPPLCPEGTRHPRQPQRSARRLSRSDCYARSRPLSRRSRHQRHHPHRRCGSPPSGMVRRPPPN